MHFNKRQLQGITALTLRLKVQAKNAARYRAVFDEYNDDWDYCEYVHWAIQSVTEPRKSEREYYVDMLLEAAHRNKAGARDVVDSLIHYRLWEE
jgi:KaiC/GvpD/RAD55 family RecA-like ATPase